MTTYGFTGYRGLIERAPVAENPDVSRVRLLRAGDPDPGGAYVLYWMQMCLRGAENLALDQAIRTANRLDLPLLVYQGLNPDYPEANARIHTFILECARDVARDLCERGIPYRFHLRRSRSGPERPVAADLARAAAYLFVDDFPAFILPGVTQGLVDRLANTAVPVAAVDGNGLVPLREIPGRQYAAYTIRPRLHGRIPEHLVPKAAPVLKRRTLPELPVPGDQFVDPAGLNDTELARLVTECDVDQSVLPSLVFSGGRRAAQERLESFVATALEDYAGSSRDPGRAATSGLSPYLHFGCLSTREIVRATLSAGASAESTDAFLEQVVVRRELAYNFCHHTATAEHTTLEALPDWARKTLAEHAADDRAYRYSPEELEAARTHDEIWNAAQRELVATGAFHGYLRMLWGKNVIRWTESYEQAQDFMVRMHHRYALDGRNPNTYASILWCFGLHDRAFREMPVLGKLRPLNSANTARKFDLDPYLKHVNSEVERRRMPVLE